MTMGYYRMQALTFLCDEVFTYIDQTINESFTVLAKENAKIRGCNSSHFMYKGTIYPKYPKTGNYSMLHVSLYSTLDEILKQEQESGKEDIKNFFSAVLSASANGIVLDALLPTILVNSLKRSMPELAYQSIDKSPPNKIISIDTTRTDIIAIKIHYAKTIERLREVLMEKMLLQG
jgi:hypothetical protein